MYPNTTAINAPNAKATTAANCSTNNPRTSDMARRVFERNRASYHPIAQQVVDSVLR